MHQWSSNDEAVWEDDDTTESILLSSPPSAGASKSSLPFLQSMRKARRRGKSFFPAATLTWKWVIAVPFGFALILCVALAAYYNHNFKDGSVADALSYSSSRTSLDPCRNLVVNSTREPENVSESMAVVIGVSGIVGSSLVIKLLNLGYHVRVLDNLPRGSIVNLPIGSPNLEIIIGNVTDTPILQRAFSGVQMAFYVSPLVDDPEPTPMALRDIIEESMVGPHHIFAAARAAGIAKVIYAGSYLARHCKFGSDVDQMWDIIPTHTLAAEGELHARTFGSLFGVPTVILRIFPVFGTGQNITPPPVSKNSTITIRDFIHVDDVVNALIISSQTDGLTSDAIEIGSGAVHYDIDTMSSPSIVIANTCDMKEKLGYIPLRSIGEEEKDLRETWFTGEKMRSAPWIMKEGDKRIPWIGLENDIDELLKVMSREESIVTLIIWNDEPISTILNHIHSLVTRGNMPSYIVAANATLSKCISLNLPCWNIEDAQIIGSKLILALLRKSVTVHLSDTKLTYTGSVKAAYTDFTSDIVVKQNIDSPYQIHTENAYIRSTPRSIRLLEHLQPSTGFSESILEAPSDAWVPCFTSEECTTLSSNDRATVAFYMHSTECTDTPSSPQQLFLPFCSATEYLLTPTQIPLSYLTLMPSNLSTPVLIWSPPYYLNITSTRLLEAPWLAPPRMRLFPYQGLHNNLTELLAIQSSNDRISLTYYNKAFYKMLLNCVYSMVHYGKTPFYIIASLDNETLEHCINMNLPCFNGTLLTGKNHGAMGSGRDKDRTYFNEMNWLKPILAHQVLNLGYHIQVGDSDLTYVRDIWGSYGGLQQRLGADIITSANYWTPINTGNYLALSTPRTRALFDAYLNLGLAHPKSNDQELFQSLSNKSWTECFNATHCADTASQHMADMNPTLYILPIAHFGCWWDWVEKPSDIGNYICGKKKDAYLQGHAACQKDKLNWLKDYSLFMLEDSEDMVPIEWRGGKHAFLPCGPDVTWKSLPLDNPSKDEA